MIYDRARHGFMRLGEDEADTADHAAHDQAWERWKKILGRLIRRCGQVTER